MSRKAVDEAASRTSESNRRIASLNRSDESNQRKEHLNDPQRLPKTVRRGPKSPQERPKTPPRRPKNPPRSRLGTVLVPTWDQATTRSKTRPIFPKLPSDLGSILAPNMGPKTTPNRPPNESKIKTKNASLFDRSWIRLGPVLRRSWDPSWGQMEPKSLENVSPRENLHF